jgi:excisionase family DNA binding protein
MSKYNFKVNELAPVFHAYLVEGQGVMFWYEGESTEYDPYRLSVEDGVQEEIPRPVLSDKTTIRIYSERGQENCIRHINTRLANYLLDEYESNHENAPDSVIKLYEKKIDLFYRWFWECDRKRNEKIFERFLRHIRSCRKKSEQLSTWHTLKEAAEYARTGVTKLRELIDEGKLKSYRLDDAKSKSTILINRKDLDAMILFNRSSGLTKRQQARLASYTGGYQN